MEAITLPIYNTEGKEVDKINLEPRVFDGEVNQNVLYQVVLMYQSNKRKGLASTKTRGEVRGGGRKPWRQKGTGRARVGSIRSPLWRGGGVVFGPHPRDYHYCLPHKIKILGLKTSLNAKLKENSIFVLDKIKLEQAKTKEIIKILSALSFLTPLIKKKQNILLLLEKIEDNLKKASGNLKFLKINLAKDTNALQVLKARGLIVTKDALQDLTERIKKSILKSKEGSR